MVSHYFLRITFFASPIASLHLLLAHPTRRIPLIYRIPPLLRSFNSYLAIITTHLIGAYLTYYIESKKLYLEHQGELHRRSRRYGDNTC